MCPNFENKNTSICRQSKKNKFLLEVNQFLKEVDDLLNFGVETLPLLHILAVSDHELLD